MLNYKNTYMWLNKSIYSLHFALLNLSFNSEPELYFSKPTGSKLESLPSCSVSSAGPKALAIGSADNRAEGGGSRVRG